MSNIDKYETRKKMVYDFMCDDMYVPMKIKELCIVLGVKKEDRPQLEQILLDLQAEGRITLSKRGKYSKSEIKKTVGVFTAHQRGFGFVTVEGEPDDIFIPAEYENICAKSGIVRHCKTKIITCLIGADYLLHASLYDGNNLSLLAASCCDR